MTEEKMAGAQRKIAAQEIKAGDGFASEEDLRNALGSIKVQVNVGEFKGKNVSVWDLLHSRYINEGTRQELLKNYRLTIKEIITIVTRTIDDMEKTEIHLTEEQISKFRSLTVAIRVGEYKDQKVNLWELLNSKYISEKKRKELLRRFKAGEMSESELINTITTIITETEERSSKLKFKGLRRQVTASELLTSEIIDQKTLNELTQGSKTVEEVTQMDLVKRYLEGTSCIAGVFVPSKTNPSKKEKMSIYQAMRKGFLRPGTALVLLEAQAATGFIIDPLKNKKLSVDEALAAEVIDQSLYAKLLSAERGVTGYKDPYTEQKISLFQAMNKELIVKDHGIRLLEAQIATGGIIDPVHSHRVPVEVAYKRGYFDEEMNQILSDPSDDTKGFFDPNTHENLTYMQLLERCVRDSETGLYMLDVLEKGAKKYDGGIKSLTFLKSKFTHISSGHFQGQQVSVWELMNYYYNSAEKRQEILKRYESGTLTIDELITNILKIIKETEQKSNSQNMNGTTVDGMASNEKGNTQKTIISTTVLIHQSKLDGENKDTTVNKTGTQSDEKDQINRALQFINIDITAGDFQGQRKTVWDLLHSKYTPEDKRNNHLKRHKTAVEEIINSLITTIEKKEEVNEIIKQKKQEGTSAHPTNKDGVPQEEDIEKALRSITVNVKVGPYQGQKVTVWDLLHSEYITVGQREELLKNYKLTVKEIIDIITRTVNDESDSFFIDQETTKTLTSLTTDINVGEYKGQKVNVWELLNSKYISEEKRKELLKRFQAGQLSESELIKTITTIIVETEERSSKLKFKGLRRQITASELLTSEIIDQKTLNELTQGSKTVEEVTQMDLVKRYLEGTSCIAGVIVPSKTNPSKKEKMSIYQAMWKGFLRPGTALVLLEAQAATGFIIDPLKNKKLSVDEALAAEVIDQSLYPKLLSAERGVTGYKDPYTEQKISLFQAMNKELIVKDHGIRLLEAQIATGGIIDPVHSHRVPVEVAYKRGYFDEEMNQILSDPSDDTKGFFDPNTHENLTYMQLLERCVRDSETGLYMLDVLEKGAPKYEGGIKSLTFLKNKFTHITSGHFQGQQVSVWELINYYYTSEEKRQEILKRYESGTLTIDELITNILTIIKETEHKSNTQNMNGTNTDVIVSNENEAGNTEKTVNSTTVINQQTQHDGKKEDTTVNKTESQSDEKDQINRALQFINIDITAGDFQGQRKTVWDLLHSKYTPEDKRNDHLKRHKTAVEEIVNSLIATIEKKEEVNEIIKQKQQEGTSAHPTNKDGGPQEEDIEKALRSITVDVKVGRYQGQKVTVWDLLHSEYITDGQREDLLKNYKLTVKEIIDIITRTVTDEIDSFIIDQEATKTLMSLTTDINVGEYKGQKVSVWELLNSKYISEEKRKELLKRFQAGEISESELIKTITTIIVETEERSSKLKFKGLRRQITASELLTSEIIDQKTLNELTQGSKTVEEVTQMDLVKRYLEGTSCIAGVFVPSKKNPSKKEKMSIYQAMWKGFLRPGTALVLLEAQAATGFIIDPLKNKKLSVDEALAAEVIDQSLYPKLLSAERGVTGYKDPYTEQKISLFQAMNKELIVKDHGIRLLEAQIATGGIIDPVHSHRVPVEVAYKRGYFDEEMNQILSDPSDDTKGFFDPNTHENLTYMQLLERCIRDSETGLYMLDVLEKGAPKYEGGNKGLTFLKNKFTLITSGHFQGQQVSVWELINYYYTSEEKRQEILKRYESGTVTIDELITNILMIIKETEHKSNSQNMNGTTVDVIVSDENEAGNTEKTINSTTVINQQTQHDGKMEDTIVNKTEPQSDEKDQINRALQFINIDITAGDFQGQRKTVWDLLHSKYTPEDKRNDHLRRHKTAVEEIINSLIATIVKKEEVNEIIKHKHQEGTSAHPTNKDGVPQEEDIEKALRSITVDVKVGRYQGQKVTVWDLLHSEYITDGQREVLLKNYKLTVKEIIDIITKTVTDETDSFFIDQEATKTLTSLTTDINVGEYKGQKVSVWELLNSKYISEEKRKELLKRFQAGEISESELIKTITTIIVETEERSSKLKFKGLRRQITASELLTSEIIDQKTLNELTQGSKTVEEVTQMDLVKRYLEGTSCIAGVFVPSKKNPSKKEKMSIYQAMWKGFLRPGTALVLLEAQAATGFIIDPLKNKKLSVDEALAAEVIDQSLYPKLLSAERGVTGYTDPYTEQKISLFQAMNKELIVKDHGIRLLEAQIATGGIIDPVHSHRVPVEVAYKRGYFDEEMNQILSDPSDDTKGFFDPNTHENLTYMQLLERCVRDSETGLYMLDVLEKGAPKYEGGIKSLTFLKNKFTLVTSGHFQGQQVSVWELINYYYTSEEKRQEILKRYESGTLTIDELITNILMIIKETEHKSNSQNMNGTALDVIVSNENEAGNTEKTINSTTVINQQTQHDGKKEVTTVNKTEPQSDEKDQINRALQFINIDITAGDFQGQRKTVWDLLHSKYTPEDKRNDHLKRHKTAVEEIINSLIATIVKKEEVNEIIKHKHQEGTSAHPTNKDGVRQEEDIEKALRSITVDVKVGRYQGQKVTVWDLLHSEYITGRQREDLLKNYKLTVKEIIDIITKTVTDETDSFFIDQEATKTLTSLTTDINVGEYKGQKVSVWELLNSKYISEEKRKELLKRFQAGEISESELIKTITTIIVETEERSSKLKFKGLRRQITASELLTSEIIDQKTLNELTQGSKTVEEVTQMDLVKRYLEGTSCIAGVIVPSKTNPSKKEKMSIYQAMWKGFLRPGTALVLLEAQAATGFIIDPLKNKKLSVDEALAAEVIDQSIYPKLLSAERGVTGYKDPYTEQKISLFQAMNKELIVKDHGIRLLEAQIATGGIIDPVHSHRVPVEVAYKRGYFDEEMNQILSDPSDDTKGFFDPNTHENLTYMQLLERCVRDSETGLYMLDVLEKGAPKYEGGNKGLTFLKNKFTHISSGHFQGQQVSVWELINYYYTSEEKRQEILKRYESGTLTIDELITNILIIIKETEHKSNSQNMNGTTVDVIFSNENEAGNTEKTINSTTVINQQTQHDGKKEDTTVNKTEPQSDEKDQINRALQFINIDITAGDFQGQRKTVWDLLHSTYVQTDERHNLLEKHRATVEKIQSFLSSTLGATEKGKGTSEAIQFALESKIIDISVGEFRGQKLSLWELLNSKYISEEKMKELLEKYQSGTITLEQLVTIIITIIEESYPSEEALKNALQDIKIDVTEGQFQGQRCSIWDLLHNESITVDKRHELLKKCRLTVREIETVVSSIINERGAGKEGLDLNDALMISQLGDADFWQVDEQTQHHLQDTLVEIPVGQFKGQKMSIWDILESTYVSKLKKSEILQKYKSGDLTVQEMSKTLITIIEKTEERRGMLLFKGLRRQVSAAELFTSEIIDKKTLDELTQGSKTLEQVNQIDSVKRYLEGTSCIAGVLLPLKKGQSKREKMSIHQAMQKNILRPGTALVLLEAQAATGFIIDPLQNKKLSVEEAVSAGVVGQDLRTKLLSAERAVTGYRDPYTEKEISLFQAMKKELIVKDHGIRLLEAQIATGGIIDPVHSHRVPVEVAYKRGYFDEEMNHILSDPSDDTKGFFDPNTHENLTYMQLLERCVQDPETRLYMLEVAEKGTSWFQIDKQLKVFMQSTLVDAPPGMFSRENISIWDIFFSRYITEEQRQELLHKFKSGKLTFEQLKTVLVTTIEQTKGKGSSEQKYTEDKEQRMEIQFKSPSGNTDTAIDKGKNDGHSESDQDGRRKSDEEIKKTLKSDEEIKKTLKYFHVNIPQLQSHNFSLLTVLSSKHIPQEEKQILFKKYTTVIEDVITILTSTFKDTVSEHSSLDLGHAKKEVSGESDSQTRELLQGAKIKITVGEFKGQGLSVWELLNSKYIYEEKRNELLRKYKSGELTLEELIQIVTTTIEEFEERSSKLKFKGLRRQVTASELLSSEIIDTKTLTDLTQGKKTLEEVTQMDSVKRYLEGTNCIAGVFVASKKDPTKMEKMSIYEAMGKRILRPGTALVLLEAQAATGFMINPLTNEKLSVDEAVSAGVIGRELHAKLLSAEKAVTGYTDPYTGQKISLFQAMNKELIVKDHGIRLLEAQIATGGIIDPVHSHRVPVEVAYKRGYFDEEMNQILSDPSDDTKGFFDPNTHENLTYMQLLERGIQDPETGLCLLSVNKK
ncbi:epiplakin [Lissotriton helveticus]